MLLREPVTPCDHRLGTKIDILYKLEQFSEKVRDLLESYRLSIIVKAE